MTRNRGGGAVERKVEVLTMRALKMPLLIALLSFFAFSALAACGGAFAEGRSEFKAGHYPHAKQIFASIETESRDYDEADRATYALYRGLTLMALGDRGNASTWLREAKAIEDTRPGTLSREDAARLKTALESAD